MCERKIWTVQEDNALKEIVTDLANQKWSSVAKILEEKYSIFGRTGKQCRERWHNQLDPGIKDDLWTIEEEQQLLKQHNALGNRWARIASALPGRTDNSIKNHFYCRLRKAVRRVNRFLSECRKTWKFHLINKSLLSKIITVAQDRFEHKLNVTEQQSDQSLDIKNRLLRFPQGDQLTSEEQTNALQLFNLIEDFNSSYKMKRGRRKRKERRVDMVQSSEDELMPQMFARLSPNHSDHGESSTVQPKPCRNQSRPIFALRKQSSEIGESDMLPNKLYFKDDKILKGEVMTSGQIKDEDPASNNIQDDRFDIEENNLHIGSNEDLNLDYIFDVLKGLEEDQPLFRIDD